MKEVYLEGVNAKIAKLLTLLDRNLYSKTYGCFDRNFWHYKIKDFPSGMSQEFTLALALVHSTDYPGNVYYRNEVLRGHILGAIRYTACSSRPDGSTDDYFPYERALGAAVFSLYAVTESYLLLRIEDPEFVKFFKHRASWIMNNEESGRLSNHYAIAALALHNTFLITKEEVFKRAVEKKIEEVVSWQDEEGWYQEYEGCDVGYLSVTIDFLAQYYQKTKQGSVLRSLEKAVDFFAEVQHPDGSAGGEYASRSTYLFHPNGFEVLAPVNEKAARIASSYLGAKQKGLIPDPDDDYIVGHGLISALNSYRNWKDRNTSQMNEKKGPAFTKHYPHSKLYIFKNKEQWGIFNLAKGGVGKIFKKGELVYNDSGVIVRLRGGRLGVSSRIDPASEIHVASSGFTVGKNLMSFKQQYATPFIFLIFRKFLFFFGPFAWSSRLLRAYLQKKMIVGKKPLTSLYRREVTVREAEVEIRTTVENASKVREAMLTTDLVPIYIAVSECFQKDMLKAPWKRLESVSGKLFRREILK